MAYRTRFNNNPYETGYIVSNPKKCGKKNCRCHTQGLLHESYALKYREYTFGYPGSKQRTKYLSKRLLSKVQQQLTNHKGEELLWFHQDEAKKFALAFAYPDFKDEQFHPLAYEHFGTSKNYKKWLK